ncbi:MAG: GNAT family N-acetyltransferase [Chloroflexales bacterium]|nr:GNAT family N-acetyltransferase [Chloroflexales bacterium]
MFELRTVRGEDAESAHCIIVECGQDMASIGYTHWTDPYPLDRFIDDAERNNVYALFLRDRIIATVSIFDRPPEHVNPAMWPNAHEPEIYVARLAVRPAYQSQGYGRLLMHFSEVTARALGLSWVRLATVATYPPIRRFYQRLGYSECGSYPLFRFEVVAYEKQVTAANHL